MRFAILLCLFGQSAGQVRASAVSENEPAKDQMNVVAKAIEAMAHSGIPQITSRFNAAEETGYYLRAVSFLGRFSTPQGPRFVCKATFVRSSPYREGAITPSRGHTFAIAFSDDFQVLQIANIGRNDTVTFQDGVVSSHGIRIFDFRSAR